MLEIHKRQLYMLLASLILYKLQNIHLKKHTYDLWWYIYISMLANIFLDTKALWKPNMVWFISLQGTNNFTNIWLHWRTSTAVTSHRKLTSFCKNNTGFVGIKAVVSSSFSEDIQKIGSPGSEFLTSWVWW